MVTIVETAPAKINLTLHVTGRGSDEYHLLDSLVMFAEVGDELGLVPDGDLTLAIDGPFASDLLENQNNLVLRAARRLTDRVFAGRLDDPLTGARITLSKNLPLASGIGGGSADAAAAMRGLRRLWLQSPDVTNDERDLLGDEALFDEIALSLGADVPMCLASRPAVARGIGEALTPLDMPSLPALLVTPPCSVSTPDVFARLQSRENPPMLPIPKDPENWVIWLKGQRNDLQPAALALEPQIGAALAALEQSPATLVRMSGSGATCFGLFQTKAQAQDAAAEIRRAHPDFWVCATTLKGSSDGH